MKILLINPMASRKAPVKGRPAHFPVALGLIAAVLKEKGHSVEVLDNETECLNRHEVAGFIRGTDYDVYGITAMSPQYSYVKGLSRLIKKYRDRPVILGGPLATYSPVTVLEHTGVDVCVIGEGEETVTELMENMDDPGRVQGIAYLKEGRPVRTAPRSYTKSRDDYPFPDYESFDMRPYLSKQLILYESGPAARLFNPIRNPAATRTIGMITGMGCPYHCAFCSRSVNRTRLRSIDNIIAEIELLKERYGVEGIFFLDDLLIINRKRTLEFCSKIKPLGLVWSGQARADILTDELAGAMRDAGCIGVGIGLESGSERMLKAMNKTATVEQNERAIRAALRNGLMVRAQLLYGFPGEDRESVEDTIALFKRVGLPPRRFNILTPLPGSALFDECLKRGLIENEATYLERVSRYEAGFATGRVLVNLTEMSDEEFEDLLDYAERTMEKNFVDLLRASHRFWRLRGWCRSLAKYAFKTTKVLDMSAWKRKLGSLGRGDGRPMTREQTEELYFRLS